MRARATLLLTAAFSAALLAPVPQASAAEATCQTEIPVMGDVDGDGLADLVVGLPAWDNSTGAVELRLTRGPSALLTEVAAGITEPERGDRFGAAVALADLDEDGCDEVIVGAPGTLDRAGRVYVLHGSPSGVVTAGRLVLDGGATPEDRFGSALAAVEESGPAGATLWVGSPYDSPRAVARAGSLTQVDVTAAGSTLQATTVATLSQATAGIPGTSEVDDHFGAVLAASRVGVLVGVPSEDIGSAKDAGAVTMLSLRDRVGGFDGATSWSQDSVGVTGAPEAGDRFGAAVSAYFGHVVVGVPGEDVGSRRDAGLVQTYLQPSTDDFPVPTGAFTQDSTGVPGVAETGDQLGASVLVGRNVGCGEGVTQLVAGAPGEDIRTGGRDRVDAGTVLVVPLTAAAACPPRYDDQSNRLAGAAETGDRLGATLGLGRVRDDHDDETGDHAFVGVPGEDRGSVADAGIVVSTAVGNRADAYDIVVAGRRLPSVGFSGGAVAGQRYGSVLASPAA